MNFQKTQDFIQSMKITFENSFYYTENHCRKRRQKSEI